MMRRFADFRARHGGRLRKWTPFAILLAMTLAWLLMGLDRDYFYRPLGHSSQSAETLAMADNLSPSRAFLIFRRMYLRADGEIGYNYYGRFPLGGYALVRLATLPFESNLAAKILAARTLMLAMFGGAALLFYLALARALRNRWAALGGVALALSGNYTLYYSDMVDTQGVMAMFGLALAFHSMSVFADDGGRFRQLALKAGAAILLDWMAFALILPFALFGAARAAALAWRREEGGGARAAFWAAARSRHAAIGTITLAVGILALGYNLANEYASLRGETPMSEMPSFESAASRVSGEGVSWSRFLRTELYRAGTAHLSLALPRYGDGLTRPGNWWEGWTVTAGAASITACAAALFWARKRASILMALAAAVFIWDLIVRQHVVNHNFAGAFHFMPALALFSLALLYAGERFGQRISALIALAAVAVFTLCAIQLNAVSHGQDAAEKAILADYETIRRMTRDKIVYLDPSIGANRSAGFPHDAAFYISSAILMDFNYEGLISTEGEEMQPRAESADFVLRRGRLEGAKSLTPNNREMFLYDPREVSARLAAEYDRLAASQDPAARGAFDIYADGGALIYAKRPCGIKDTRARFFLHAYAADFYDLPRERRFEGFEGLDFRFGEHGTIFGDMCMARAELPRYAISKIDTGQFASGEGRLWSAELRFDADMDERFRKAYQSAAIGEPAARSVFDVYLTDGAAVFVKEPCAEDDARGRFLLSAYPSDSDNLEDGREESGHNSLNFSFADYGGIVDGVCVIRRPLPDYALERLTVGQWIPGGDTLWRAEISVGD